MSVGLYIAMTTPEKIALMLELRGMRKAELARAVGVDNARVTRWLSGEVKPNIHMLLVISRSLAVPMEYFVDEQMTEPPIWDALTQKEREVLAASRIVGHETALQRIMQAPGVNPPPGATVSKIIEASHPEG